MNRNQTRCGIGFTTALTMLVVGAGIATAAPVISVRSRAEIVLDPVERVAGGVLVRGRLQDRASLEPVPDTVVQLQLDDQSTTALTDETGTFEYLFPLTDEGSHHLSAAFTGDGRRTGHTAELERFDVAKRPVALVLRAEETPPGAGDIIPLAIAARSEDEPIQISVKVWSSEVGQDPTLLGTATTDASGSASLSVPIERFGAPGKKEIEVRFAGDDTFNPAAATADLLVRSITRLTFAFAEDSIAFEGELSGTGRLVDRNGDGVARAPIALRSGDRKLKDTLTDASGAFSFRMPATELEVGIMRIQAVFESDRPWLENSHSPLIDLQISERRPMPVGYTLAAFGATALALLTFVGLRVRPWERWLPRLRDSGFPEEAPSPREGEEVHTGLAQSRAPLSALVKAASDFGFTGAVRDAVSGKPLAAATLVLLNPIAGQRNTTTDERGHFACESLPQGDWTVSVYARGYVTEQFPISVPHRGTLRHARVDLVPVRERIFEMYRALASPLLPRPKLWGVWTPRQIFDHVRRGRPAPALAQLTDYVEEKYFSARVAEEPELERAARLIEAARCEEPGSVL